MKPKLYQENIFVATVGYNCAFAVPFFLLATWQR